MLRIVGWIFMALAGLAFWRDWSDAGGAPTQLAPLGQRWAELDRNSLVGLQAGIENRLDPSLFFDYVLPVLQLPAVMALAGTGVAFLLLGRILSRPRH